MSNPLTRRASILAAALIGFTTAVALPVIAKPRSSPMAKCAERCGAQVNDCAMTCVAGAADAGSDGAGGSADGKCVQRCQERMDPCMKRCGT